MKIFGIYLPESHLAVTMFCMLNVQTETSAKLICQFQILMAGFRSVTVSQNWKVSMIGTVGPATPTLPSNCAWNLWGPPSCTNTDARFWEMYSTQQRSSCWQRRCCCTRGPTDCRRSSCFSCLCCLCCLLVLSLFPSCLWKITKIVIEVPAFPLPPKLAFPNSDFPPSLVVSCRFLFAHCHVFYVFYVFLWDFKCEHHYNTFKSWFYRLPYDITLLYNAFSCCSTCACKSLHAPFWSFLLVLASCKAHSHIRLGWSCTNPFIQSRLQF